MVRGLYKKVKPLKIPIICAQHAQERAQYQWATWRWRVQSENQIFV